MAVSSAVNMDTGGREKNFLKLRNSGMAKAAPAEPSSSTDPSVKKMFKTASTYLQVARWLCRLGEEGPGPSSVLPPPPPPFPSARRRGGGGGGGGGRGRGDGGRGDGGR